MRTMLHVHARRMIAILATNTLVLAAVAATGTAAPSKLARAADLVVTTAAPSPTSVLPGGTITISTTVRNSGKSAARAFALRAALSTNATFDSRDVALGAATPKGVLGAAKSSAIKLKVVVPIGTKPGSYRIIVCADATNKVRERNEKNNCRATSAVTIRSVISPVVIVPPNPGPKSNDPTPPGPGPTTAVPDTTAPDTTITSAPSATSYQQNPRFTFTSSEAGSSFRCSFDGGAAYTCSTPHTLFATTIGMHTFTVAAVDASGNVDTSPASHSWQIVSMPSDDPAPDPDAAATPIDLTVTESHASRVAFLYSGPDAVQKDVQPGAIEEARVSVLRGRVVDANGAPLAGIRVSVLDRGELGHTATRVDGGYDIAVNGGGNVELSFLRAGYLPVTRNVDVPWEDFVPVEDVTLIAVSDEVTDIDPSIGGVVTGEETNDDDGERTAALVVDPGTQATMTLPDGTERPIDDLDIRITEYTAGDAGPQRMPGELPGASAYTYAVEMTVDEALEEGATNVEFSKPLASYTDNFLGFPTGSDVPAGYFDRERNEWVAAPSGRVIEIIAAPQNAMAQIDVSGDGDADNEPLGGGVSAALIALGIDNAELQRIAQLYPTIGQTFWRVQISHFTPWDYNWPYAPPADAVAPDMAASGTPNLTGTTNGPSDDGCKKAGSIIDCVDQVLGESITITGSNDRLRYASDRAPGRTDKSTVTIPVTPATAPPSLQRIELILTVAGQTHGYAWDKQPASVEPPIADNLKQTFTWDGLDAYGRKLQGRHPLTATLKYIYPASYKAPNEFAQAFGRPSTAGGSVVASRTAFTVTMQQELTYQVGVLDTARSSAALGGWDLESHHSYDTSTDTINFGDGTSRVVRELPWQTERIAGRYDVEHSDFGGAQMVDGVGVSQRVPSTSVNFARGGQGYKTQTMVAAPDGSVYVASGEYGVIRRVYPDGTTEAVFNAACATDTDGSCSFLPGTNTTRPSGNGGLASQGFAHGVGPMAVGPDGLLYFLSQDTSSFCSCSKGSIRRITAEGLVEHVAGQVTDGFPTRDPWHVYEQNGNLGRMITSSDSRDHEIVATSMAIAPDGTIFLGGLGHVRRLDSDGYMTLAVGKERPEGDANEFTFTNSDFAPSGTIATDFPIELLVTDMAVRPDGTLVFLSYGSSDSDAVAQLNTDGTVDRLTPPFTENGDQGQPGPGVPASDWNSFLFDGGLELDQNGGIYVSHGGSITYITPDGFTRGVSRPNNPISRAYDPAIDDGGRVFDHVWGSMDHDVFVALPDGSLVRALPVNALGSARFQLVRMSAPVPDQSASTLVVPSPDGSELYKFDEGGKHLQTIDALQGFVRREFGYDDEGRLTSVDEHTGADLTITRNGAGVPLTLVGRGGQTTNLLLDGAGYLRRVTAPSGAETDLEHTSTGLLTKLTTPDSGEHTFGYAPGGLLSTDTGPTRTQSLVRTNIPTGWQVVHDTGDGSTTTRRTELPDGSVRTVVTNEIGGETVTDVGTDGTSTRTTADGTTTTTTYAPDPRFGMVAAFVASNTITRPSGRTSTMTRTRAVTPEPGNIANVATMSDVTRINGTAVSSTSWTGGATRSLVTSRNDGRSSTTLLDALGRTISHQPATGITPIQTSWNGAGLIATRSGAGGTASYTYDARGNRTSVTHDGATTTYTWHPTRALITSMTSAEGSTYAFTYDAAGRRTGWTAPGGKEHSYAMSGGGRIDAYSPPTGGDIAWTYDAAGKLVTTTTPGGDAITFGYDAQGRYERSDFGTGRISLTFEGLTSRIATATRQDGSGTPTQSATTTYDGDAVTGETWTGAAAGAMTRSLDSTDRITSQTELGETTSVTRDLDGMSTNVGRTGSQFEVTRDAQTGAAIAFDDGTGRVATTHDSDGRITGRALAIDADGAGPDPAVEVFRLGLAFGGQSGRISQRTLEIDGAPPVVTAFTYNLDGQLTSVDGALDEHYDYDARGNRTSVQRPGDGAPQAATFTDSDQVTAIGATNVTHDDNGVLATRGGDASFDYDRTGLLNEATVGGSTATYQYDAMNRRVSVTVAGDTIRYFYGAAGDPHRVSSLRAPDGTLSHFSYDENGALFAIQRGAERFYVGSDHARTPHVIADATGAVVRTYEWDAWGRPTGGTDADPTIIVPVGFGGGLPDATTGLVRFGVRDYDPQLGQWAQRDPLLDLGSLRNLYAYANSDPINQIDASGMLAVGFSAYEVLGGGGKVVVSDNILQICAQGGAGAGGGLEVDLFAKAQAGASFESGYEMTAAFAGMGMTGGLTTNNSGVAADPCAPKTLPSVKLTFGPMSHEIYQDEAMGGTSGGTSASTDGSNPFIKHVDGGDVQLGKLEGKLFAELCYGLMMGAPIDRIQPRNSPVGSIRDVEF